MKRPNTALAGIDQKLSAEVTRALFARESRMLTEIRIGCQHARTMLKVVLLLAVVVVLIGVQLPGASWLLALSFAAALAAAGLLTFRVLRSRGLAAFNRLHDLIAVDYGAELVSVRPHDLVVSVGRTLVKGR